MSLSFTISTSHAINCGSGGTLDNLTTLTALAWVYPLNLSTTSVLFYKEAGSLGLRKLSLNDGGAGILLLEMKRATVDCYTLSASGYVVTNEWQFIGGTMNTAGAIADQRLFRGTLGSPASEPGSYVDQSVGSGAVDSDAAGAQYVGNWAALDFAFGGLIFWAGMWNRQLSAPEIRQVQALSRTPPQPGYLILPPAGCVLWIWMDSAGVVRDYSGFGNLGVVSGATSAQDMPLLRPRRLVRAVPAGPITIPINLSAILSPSGTISKQGQKPFTGVI